MSSTDAFLFPDAAQAGAAAALPGEQDLGPLAWVIDELRRSLEGAARTLGRFAREPAAEPALDTLALQQALHQAGGALEMVEMRAPAQLVQAMEAALLRLAQEHERCTPEAAAISLAEILSPSRRIASAEGPRKRMPASVTRSTKRGSSATKPQPGQTASAPARRSASRMPSWSR